MPPFRLPGGFLAALLLAAAGPLPNTVHAQPPGPPDVSSSRPLPAPDFFLDRPVVTIGVRGGWTFARAGSDIYDFITEQLTVEKSDFNGPGLALDLGFPLGPRFEPAFGLEITRSSTQSEYRDYVDDDLLPIEQETKLKTVSLTGSIRYALVPRWHTVSRLALVPQRTVPYVGAGGGMVWHELVQSGDFVDFEDLSVFTEYFDSRGWAPTAHVFGGVDFRLHGRLFASVEGRYVWASDTLGSDFIDFEPIDLSGFRTTAGISLVF